VCVWWIVHCGGVFLLAFSRVLYLGRVVVSRVFV
jgi:hypothetical protein